MIFEEFRKGWSYTMSVSLILFPLALAFGASVGTVAISTTAAAVAVTGSKAVLAVAAEAHLRHLNHLKKLYMESQNEALPPIETIFVDGSILEKTMIEHGLSVSVLSGNQIICQLGEVYLDYSRQTAEEPFKLTISGLQKVDEFFNELECFEREYKQNVQSYTYNRLIDNLSENNMKVAEEVLLDDNSIMLTIDI